MKAIKYLIQFTTDYWLAITALVLTFITIGSLYPAEHLPNVPGSDKTHHFVSYCALVLPTMLKKPKYWYGLVLFYIGWSGAIEIIQPYVNRYGEWLDLLANCGGIALGMAIAMLLKKSLKFSNL